MDSGRQEFLQDRAKQSEQAESNFDGDNDGNGFAARSHGGLEAPLLHGFDGFFFQTKSRDPSRPEFQWRGRPRVMTAWSTTVP